MTKRYMNAALLYAILAMAGGVFYREFTKALGYTGTTTLAFVHVHWFMLGMAFFLILLLVEKTYRFSNAWTAKALVGYHIGLNLTVVMLVVRGVLQALGTPLASGADAAISGIAGLGHLVLGVSLVLVLVRIRRAVIADRRAQS